MKTKKIKTGVVALIMFGCGTQSFAQAKVLYKAELKKQDVPEIIIENVETDFPDFVLEEFYAIPVEYVEDDIIVDTPIESSDDYETYQVVLKDDKGFVKALYNKEGNLLYTEEHEKNIAPPVAIRNSIAKAFPGWAVKSDSYKMTHSNGRVKKERYKVQLEKGNEKKKVYLDASGDILQAR